MGEVNTHYFTNKPIMAKIAVTGGAGFIGTCLTKRLLSEGHEVLVVDNMYTGSKDNIEPFLTNPRFEFIRHDVIEPLLLEVDQIYHLACPASPVHYQANPVKTVKTSVLGTMNMLGLAKRVGARILIASTSEVYGDPQVHPQPEGYWGHVNPIGPRSCYDEGKRIAETLTYSYVEKNNVDAVIVRIFNTYGPRMLFNDGRVVSNFVHQALTGQDLSIYGDGSQTRSFCFVDDLVDGLIRAQNCSGFAGPVNLGNPVESTVKELANLVLKLTDSESALRQFPLPPDDPVRRKPDITLARDVLKWEPKVPLEKGLIKMIADFKERITAIGFK